ncbi:uncharacterized protein LOC144103261 [Amblyomma americanum]
MANLGEWLKEAKAYDESEKMMQCFGLEQFYRQLPEDIRHWVQDRQDVTTVSKAADLEEEFVSRRALDRKESPKKEYQNRKTSGERGQLFKVKEHARSEERQKKAFEKRRAPVCYNCQKPGHMAAVCKNPKVVCLSVDSNEENLKLLEPYIRDLVVNGKPCRVLRDSAATMDVVHPSYVEPGQFTGECAWIKKAVEANSMCLPIANISIEGPFGVLHTEAAVSASLPMQYPYLFSNRSDQLLRQKDLVFGEGTVYALTRSKARKIAAKAMPLEASSSVGTVESEPPDASGEVPATATEEVNILGRPESSKNCMELKEAYGELLITPASDSLQRLLGVDRSSLISEQRADSPLQNLRCREEEGVAKKIVLFQERKTEPQILRWDEKKEKAFLALKSALLGQPVLQAPDYSRPFVVQYDASDRGMGVVLCQRAEEEEEHPVLYASRHKTRPMRGPLGFREGAACEFMAFHGGPRDGPDAAGRCRCTSAEQQHPSEKLLLQRSSRRRVRLRGDNTPSVQACETARDASIRTLPGDNARRLLSPFVPAPCAVKAGHHPSGSTLDVSDGGIQQAKMRHIFVVPARPQQREHRRAIGSSSLNEFLLIGSEKRISYSLEKGSPVCWAKGLEDDFWRQQGRSEVKSPCAQDGALVCPMDGMQCLEEDVEWKEWSADDLLKRQTTSEEPTRLAPPYCF